MNRNLDKVQRYILSERKNDGMTCLDWNESVYKPEPVIKYFKETPFELYNLYPDPMDSGVKASLETYTGVSSDCIEVFSGSDSALDCCFRSVLNHGDIVTIPFPNYTQVNQTITSMGASINYCDINELHLNLDKSTAVYISIPNNPIGYVYDILPLVKAYPSVIFIVDEAYYEFSGVTVFNEARHYENLIVTRTFSKALCLASIRLGYLSACEKILTWVRTLKNYKEVSRIAQIAGVQTISNIEWYREKIAEVIRNREAMENELRDYIYEKSFANFVLIKHPCASQIVEECKNSGILVRDRSSLIPNTFRVTIGTPEDNKKIIEIVNLFT
jgi:histidinol-phosphate aminotransferase